MFLKIDHGRRKIPATFWRKGGTSRVWLSPEFPGMVLIAERLGYNQKEVTYHSQDDANPNPHLPMLKWLGELPDGRDLYSCPKYEPSKKLRPDVPAEKMVIDLIARRISRLNMRRQAITRYSWEWDCMDSVGILDDMRQSPWPQEAHAMGDALHTLLSQASNYGTKVCMDLDLRNMLRDDQGRLVLMDVIVPEPTPQ